MVLKRDFCIIPADFVTTLTPFTVFVLFVLRVLPAPVNPLPFCVNVHFAENTTDTVEDKLLHLMGTVAFTDDISSATDEAV